MQNWLIKWLIIVLLVGLCILGIALKPFRLGSDLRGGTSLIYSVSIPDDAGDPQQILAQTIEVLKERINPTGVLDIYMQPLGNDRLEIVMPLPDERVRALGNAYRAELEKLLRLAEIRSAELTAAIEAGTAEAKYCADGEGARCQAIRSLQQAHTQYKTALDAYERAKADGLTGGEMNVREQAVADSQARYENALTAALDYSLERTRVVRTLQLQTDRVQKRDPTTGEVVIDPATGEAVLEPSPRDLAVTTIRSEFPHLAAQLDSTIAAYDVYKSERKGFDDPEDLIRLLRGAGVLEFRIAVRPSQPQGVNVQEMRDQLAELGPDNTDSVIARWFKINQINQWFDSPQEQAELQANPVGFFDRMGLTAAFLEGNHYLLLYITDTKSLTHGGGRNWSIVDAYPTTDDLGRPAVGFRLDTAGGGFMGQLTSPHVTQPMAIVLDGEVYTAPTLNSAISSNGIIQGSFSQNELNYLIRVLAAGALEARLSPEPIATNTLGPSLGKDNLERGREAFIIAVIAVAIFMFGYYFFAGLVADAALILNGVMIFGFMAMIDGTFTLPGLAGIVLTIGMAVDANVLIYERIREEMFSDEWDLRGAIREGYKKALSAIIDGNVTNLIVCFVLAQTATTEVKGFAVTLSIGIGATLFTALFVTRQVYYLYTDVFGGKKLVMLPSAVPAIHRFLEPNIDWIGLRKFFLVVSSLAVIGSIVVIFSRGADMLDTEFRGGASILMRTHLLDPNADPDDGARLQLVHSVGDESVQARVQSIGADVTVPDAPGPERTRRLVLREFRNASVVTVGDTEIDPQAGAITASRFQIKIPSPKELGDEVNITDSVVDALADEFGDQLDVVPALDFDGANSDDYTTHTVRIDEATLGANLPGFNNVTNVRDFLGGVGVVLRNVDPPTAVADLEQRIDRMRQQPDFTDCLGRNVLVVGLTEAAGDFPQPRYHDAVVVVYDSNNNYRRKDAEIVDREVAAREWRLVNEALTNPSSMEQVSSFSSAVAQTMKAKAVVAVILSLLGILVYIWVRFGSLRYSVAATVALAHDVTIALGILGLTGLVGGTFIASVLLVEEFKIDLGVVAAMLTIIGYSLNDTIVILDRIRENRGKLPLPTAPIVNKSINQTISRTTLTSFTTLLAVAIMYAEGGSGIRAFAFTLLVGIVVGTYSSIAVAAPLVFTRKGPAGRPTGSENTAAAADQAMKPVSV